ncbi:MAG: YggU family protein [Gammaproteobacteria bacterium]|nr:YggU family protein [Gammaproteobacteria bacterium]
MSDEGRVPSGACQWRSGDLTLHIRLQPRASKDEIVGWHGDALKVRITAPPVDGKANKHLLAYLAKRFKVPTAQVTLVSGQTGRDKRVCIQAPRHIPAPIPDPD